MILFWLTRYNITNNFPSWFLSFIYLEIPQPISVPVLLFSNFSNSLNTFSTQETLLKYLFREKIARCKTKQNRKHDLTCPKRTGVIFEINPKTSRRKHVRQRPTPKTWLDFFLCWTCPGILVLINVVCWIISGTSWLGLPRNTAHKVAVAVIALCAKLWRSVL